MKATEGCGFGPCRNSRERGGPGCYLCDEVAHLPQSRTMDGIHARDKANAARDGERPDKDATNLAFKKRHRVGPHR